jgi:hypothetical protein
MRVADVDGADGLINPGLPRVRISWPARVQGPRTGARESLTRHDLRSCKELLGLGIPVMPTALWNANLLAQDMKLALDVTVP